MSTLYIGPTRTNDTAAYHAFHRRIAAKDGPIFIPMHHVVEADLLAGPWFGIRSFFNDHLPEMHEVLHTHLQSAEVSCVHVDIGGDLGTLYAAYYALLEPGRLPVDITLHTPHSSEEYEVPALDAPLPEEYSAGGERRGQMPTKTIQGRLMFGGAHLWSRMHPLTLRRLALIVLNGARDVWVTNQDDAERLYLTFPTLDRPVEGAPLNAIGSAS